MPRTIGWFCSNSGRLDVLLRGSAAHGPRPDSSDTRLAKSGKTNQTHSLLPARRCAASALAADQA